MSKIYTYAFYGIGSGKNEMYQVRKSRLANGVPNLRDDRKAIMLSLPSPAEITPLDLSWLGLTSTYPCYFQFLVNILLETHYEQRLYFTSIIVGWVLHHLETSPEKFIKHISVHSSDTTLVPAAAMVTVEFTTEFHPAAPVTRSVYDVRRIDRIADSDLIIKKIQLWLQYRYRDILDTLLPFSIPIQMIDFQEMLSDEHS